MVKTTTLTRVLSSAFLSRANSIEKAGIFTDGYVDYHKTFSTYVLGLRNTSMDEQQTPRRNS
jgi:hypothetical protein